MRRYLAGLGAAALVAAAAGAFTVSLFLARPGLFLTAATVGPAIRRLGARCSPTWSALRVSAVAVEARRHRYVLQFDDACVRDREGVFSGCFSRLELGVVVSYSRGGPVLERVERLIAVAKSARLDLRRRAPGAGVGSLAGLLTVPVTALRVELPRFSASWAKTDVTGALSVVLAAVGDRPLAVSTDLRIRSGGGASRLKGELTAETDLLGGHGPTYMDVTARADLGPQGHGRTSFRARRAADEFVVSGSAELAPSTGPLRALRFTACAGRAPLAFGRGAKADATLTCRFALLPSERLAGRLGPKASATGRIALRAGLSKDDYRVSAKADLDPLGPWWTLSGGALVSVAGRLDRPWTSAKVRHVVDAEVAVPHFQDLVGLLRRTDAAIPAPVRVLNGPLSLSVRSRGDPRSGRQTADYAFASDLRGDRQRLVLRGTGAVVVSDVRSPKRAFLHTGELILEDVALELPRLDVGRAPKTFVDGRIRMRGEALSPAPDAATTGAAAPLRAIPLRGSLAVKTAKPLVLFSNLAKDPVPIGLDLVLTYPQAEASGAVSVRSFDVELFRRDATLDHLNVALSSGSAPGALEGLVLYKTPRVQIRILIGGTTEKPRIEFASVPPMKRSDIIALLIFGKNPGDLDPEQAASVGNAETALESRAFGLASLYLFGATPVERVGYDSATRTATIEFRLPGGVALSVGGDFDQSRRLSLRKPLAPHWALQSEVGDQGSQSRAATTFLEWFNRY